MPHMGSLAAAPNTVCLNCGQVGHLMCFGSLWQTGQTGTTPVCPQGIDPNFQGTVFLPQLHGHVLMPDTNQTVCVCSVCKTSPNKGNAYRCKTCNFDCCAQCFSTVSAFSSWKLPPPPPPPLFPLASFRRFPSPPRFRQSQHSRANLPEAAKVASRLSFEAREKWTTDGMGSEVLVDVDPGSSEFGEIASALLCTLDNQSVVRIQRVENGAQHELFSVQLRNIARRLGAEFSPETMIRHIFHGEERVCAKTLFQLIGCTPCGFPRQSDRGVWRASCRNRQTGSRQDHPRRRRVSPHVGRLQSRHSVRQWHIFCDNGEVQRPICVQPAVRSEADVACRGGGWPVDARRARDESLPGRPRPSVPTIQLAGRRFDSATDLGPSPKLTSVPRLPHHIPEQSGEVGVVTVREATQHSV